MVDTANVPQDHRGLGASRWIAILGSCRYAGRGGIGRLREEKDFLSARWSLCCMRRGTGRSSSRGSMIDQYSEHT
jgi:hypothetical protein